jgi:hypothetical protein
MAGFEITLFEDHITIPLVGPSAVHQIQTTRCTLLATVVVTRLRPVDNRSRPSILGYQRSSQVLQHTSRRTVPDFFLQQHQDILQGIFG